MVGADLECLGGVQPRFDLLGGYRGDSGDACPGGGAFCGVGGGEGPELVAVGVCHRVLPSGRPGPRRIFVLLRLVSGGRPPPDCGGRLSCWATGSVARAGGLCFYRGFIPTGRRGWVGRRLGAGGARRGRRPWWVM